jgi:hypothetical protein
MSNKNYRIHVENYKIKSIDILHFTTDLKIFVSGGGRLLYRNDNIVEYASKYGHVEVLEWFKNSGYEFKYSAYAITAASENGHIQVLEWFKNSGYKFKYNVWAIIWASGYGHIQVLEWFKNSGYKFKYLKRALTTNFIRILKFYGNHINIKKLIKWSKKIIFIKTIKFKTRNKYLKGYQKN